MDTTGLLLHGFDMQHIKAIEALQAKIRTLYVYAIREAVHLARLNKTGVKPFTFANYPATAAKFEGVLKKMVSDLTVITQKAVQDEWMRGELKNDALVNQVFGLDTNNPRFSKYLGRNIEGLEAFKKRQVKGLGLSDRIWKVGEQFKGEVELQIANAISRGESAATLARNIKQGLTEPDRLFRRVKGEDGVLRLSRPAKLYHPGQGVYRSSYKNAMRVSRTEINMAYRAADYSRVSDLPFVKGVLIKISNNPKHVYDICDELQGFYPKEFKWVGWHPQCMCNITTVLATGKELEQLQDIILSGGTPTGLSNMIVDTPANFHAWMSANVARSLNWKSQPYWIKDNFTGGTLEGKKIYNPLNKTNGAGVPVFNITPKPLPISAPKMPKAKQAETYAGELTEAEVEKIYGEISKAYWYDYEQHYLDRGYTALTYEEAYPIFLYSGSSYRYINEYFYKGNVELGTKELIENWDKLLNHSLLKLNKLQGEKTVTSFRGSNTSMANIDKILDAHKAGTPWSPPSYFSTSASDAVAKDFMETSNAAKQRYFITIKSKNGVDITKYSELNEDEILFARGTRFRILNIKQDEQGIWRIEMEDF